MTEYRRTFGAISGLTAGTALGLFVVWAGLTGLGQVAQMLPAVLDEVAVALRCALAVLTPTIMVALAAGGTAFGARLCAERRRPVDRCRTCGYSIVGNVSERCPECGGRLRIIGGCRNHPRFDP